MAASGGYMIACAADEIVCDPASIVGSIGVIGASFGFTEAIRKLGVERRIYTAGDNKSMLDPFLPEKEEDVARLKSIQREIHEMFIDLVRKSRGERLTGPEKTLFSGEYWTAKTALEYGVVDRLIDLRAFLRERYGEDVVTPVVAGERSLFGWRKPGVSRLVSGLASGFASGLAPERLFDGAGLMDDFISAVESRSIWSRFGL